MKKQINVAGCWWYPLRNRSPVLGVGVASGGKNYVKTADLNRISGNAMMDSSDSHVILSKTKINSFSSVNVDLRNLDLECKRI